ncbi:hypothetical protein QZH41_019648 [Actinostola sp. cb2023]|nr:hypothetical protein QZH41_019648 [Actinostola sp. cb2023]
MADEVDSLVQEFHLLKCSSLQPVVDRSEPVYITHATIGQETKALATGETSGNVRICELENMTQQKVLGLSFDLAHKNNITGLEFSKANEKLLWTSSSCSIMNCWDLRGSCERPVQKLTSPNSSPYTCCGVGCDGDIVAGATEPTGDDVCLYVWDVRSPNPIFTSIFTDSHKEDITQIKFHPRRSKHMASCSTDGLVCLFDVSHAEEDDALQFVFNSGSSVGRIGFYADRYNKLFCITHIETLQLWDINEVRSSTSDTFIKMTWQLSENVLSDKDNQGCRHKDISKN